MLYKALILELALLSSPYSIATPYAGQDTSVRVSAMVKGMVNGSAGSRLEILHGTCAPSGITTMQCEFHETILFRVDKRTCSVAGASFTRVFEQRDAFTWRASTTTSVCDAVEVMTLHRRGESVWNLDRDIWFDLRTNTKRPVSSRSGSVTRSTRRIKISSTACPAVVWFVPHSRLETWPMTEKWLPNRRMEPTRRRIWC